MKRNLYNKKNREQLLDQLNNENFKRITCSFYKYIKLENLDNLRDELYSQWNDLKVLGRVYIAEEGINAQISLPDFNLEKFKENLFSYLKFKNILIKPAVQEGLSFLKLTIKVKNEIVAYKVPKNQFDMTKVGNHLDYNEYHKKIDKGAIVIDMRNQYEGEVGHFKNAIIPNVNKSEDLLPTVKELLKDHKDNTVLMYCTGGIRCEKASSYLIKNGFKDVNQLNGGIIKYANDIKKDNIKSKFIGKNFVFDHRLGENITDDIISNCHQCGNSSNKHLDCENQACHILFIQCEDCAEKYKNCCSKKCADFNQLPRDEQKRIFKMGKIKFTAQIFNEIKPRLSKINLDKLT
tara:strand:+ start:854 stop:1900 length:1047 start_codon:yes stop_codon:yes gene_type:complete